MENGNKKQMRQKTNSKMTDLNLTISIITFNVNVLNAPITRQRL